MKKNLITVLKKLLAAFGGEETQSNNAVEVIDKIADAANGVTEKELPEATAEDVGKAVMVDENGGYTLGRAGGETVLTAKITTLSPVTCTMKPSEIKNALDAGTWVRALYQTEFEICTGIVNVNKRNTGAYPNEVMLNFVIRGGTPGAPKKVTVFRFIGNYNNDTWTYENITVVE